VDITVLCPTRGNPTALREAYFSFRDTAMERSSRFVAVVDESDPLLGDYVTICEDTVDLRIDLVPRDVSGSMNAALNYAAMRWVDRCWVLGFIGDDHRFRTKGWDRTINTVMAETGGGFVYGNDLFQGEALPTEVFISSKIVSALGWFGLPGAKHLYLDNTWKLLGDRADCLYYLPDVVIEHMHPAAGKGDWDANHVRVNAPEIYSHDSHVYDQWMRSDMDAAEATVRKALGR
jgi:hypothetical protein